MPWVFPEGKVPIALSVMDYEQVNRNLQPYIDLFSGGLTEHNFSDDMATGLTVASDYADGVAWRVDLVEEYPADYTSLNPADSDCVYELQAEPIPDDDLYRSGGGWQRVRGLEWAGVVRSGALRCIANIQVSQSGVDAGFPTYSATAVSSTNSFLGSSRFCFELDGAPLPETTFGDVDDLQGAWMEHGVRLANVAELDAILPVSPGYHTVRVLVYVDRMTIPQASGTCVAVGRATLFTWELD